MAFPDEMGIASPWYPCADCHWRLSTARLVSELVAQGQEEGHIQSDEK